MDQKNKSFEQVQNELKNVAKGSFLETLIDNGFYILTFQNNTNDIKIVEREIDSSYIQFHFCIKGLCAF